MGRPWHTWLQRNESIPPSLSSSSRAQLKVLRKVLCLDSSLGIGFTQGIAEMHFRRTLFRENRAKSQIGLVVAISTLRYWSRQKNLRGTFATQGKFCSSCAAREDYSCCRLAKGLQSLLYGLQCNGHAYHKSCSNGQWAGLPGCLSYSAFRHRDKKFRHRDKGRLWGLTRGLTIPNHMIPPHTMQCRAVLPLSMQHQSRMKCGVGT